jgi:hypothetical protein
VKLTEKLFKLLEVRRTSKVIEDREDSRPPRKERTPRQPYIKEPEELKVLKNDDRVFALRRQIIGYIYELKKIDPELPRIQVRVVDSNEYKTITKSGRKIKEVTGSVLGMAWVSKNAIYIDADNCIKHSSDMFEVVAHEIVHAAYGARHVKDQKDLMYPYHRKSGDDFVKREFAKWHKWYKEGRISSNGLKDDNGSLTKWYVVT